MNLKDKIISIRIDISMDDYIPTYNSSSDINKIAYVLDHKIYDQDNSDDTDKDIVLMLLLSSGKIIYVNRNFSSIPNIKLYTIEKQLELFNKHFFKYILPPIHLKKHIQIKTKDESK